MCYLLPGILRTLLAGVFAFSALSHLKHPWLLLDHVLAYRLVSGWPAVVVALFLPLLETLLAALLLSRLERWWAGGLCLFVLLVFAAAQVSALARGLQIECGCFGGVVRREIGWEALGFLVLMMVCSALLAFPGLSSRAFSALRSAANGHLRSGGCSAKVLLLVNALTLCVVSGNAFAQEGLLQLPADTEAFVHLQDPSALANELRWFRDVAATDQRLRSLMVEGPDPLTDEDGFAGLLATIDSLEQVLRSTGPITLAVRGLASDPEYLLVVQETGPKLAGFVGLWKALSEKFGPAVDNPPPERLGSDKPPSDGTKEFSDESAQEAVDRAKVDLVGEVARWLKRLRPEVLELDGSTTVFSNSQRWLDWTKQASLSGFRGTTLAGSRRYQRALSALGANGRETALIWFIPAVLYPLWDKSLDDEKLRRFGYEELVGAMASLGIGREASGDLVRLRMAVPFTVPAQGIVSLWKSYQPIDRLPPLADYIELSQDRPWELTVENRDRRKYFRLREELYESRGERELLEKKLAEEAAWHPDLANYRDYFSGKWVRLTMRGDLPKPQYYTLDFLAIGDRQATLDYARHSARLSEKDSKFPKPETEINGHPAWFRSAADNLELTRQGQDNPEAITLADRHLVRNMGMVATERWLIMGDHSQVLEFLRVEGDETVEANREFGRLASLSANLIDAAQPSWLAMRFPGTRREEAVETLRFLWLSQSMAVGRARELASGWDTAVPLNESLPVENTSDRLFGIADWCLYQLLTRYHHDVTMFTCHDSHFEWRWSFFPDSND